MKIAWFTPFSTASAIGACSNLSTALLAKSCEVHLWLCESENLIATNLKIISYELQDEKLRDLKNYDIIIYNMGNYFGFHGKIFEVSRLYPGVVILHDYVMHHFMAHYFCTYLGNTALYLAKLKKHYGKLPQHTPQSDWLLKFPLFEEAIKSAKGVITHSEFLARKVRGKFPGPVRALYFPYFDDARAEVDTTLRPQNKEKRLTLLTVGHLNSNKRIHNVLRALASVEEFKTFFHYEIIGPLDNLPYVNELREIIEQYGLSTTVTMHGFQSSDFLREACQRADIFINLRFPTTEGSSWSLLEEFDYGKPIVVSDTGSFSEIPGNCVIKTNPAKEQRDLVRLFKKLIVNPDFYKQTGSDGRKYARATYSQSAYASGFLDFVQSEILEDSAVTDVMFAVGIELREMRVHEKSTYAKSIADKLHRFFSGAMR